MAPKPSPPQDKPAVKAKSQFSTLIKGATLAAVFILATPSAMMASILLLPSLLAWIGDRAPGHPTVRAVLLFGMAASCAPLDILWRNGHQMADALALLSDTRTLALAWAAQAGGWLLTQVMPVLIGAWGEAQHRIEVIRLNRRRETLQQEWNSTPN